MMLKCLSLDMIRPENQPIGQLRGWVLDEILRYGEPLRWAITGLEPLANGMQLVQVEAVVIMRLDDYS